jgi:hypothetical protein
MKSTSLEPFGWMPTGNFRKSVAVTPSSYIEIPPSINRTAPHAVPTEVALVPNSPTGRASHRVASEPALS